EYNRVFSAKRGRTTMNFTTMSKKRIHCGLSFLLVAGLLAGCPEPGPGPDPDPEPTASIRFQTPLALASDLGPESVAVALLNGDAFPDLVTANGADNTLTVWIAAGMNSYNAGQRLLPRGTAP